MIELLNIPSVPLDANEKARQIAIDLQSRRLYIHTDQDRLFVLYINVDSRQSFVLYCVEASQGKSKITSMSYFMMETKELCIVLGHQNGSISWYRNSINKQSHFHAHKGRVNCLQANYNLKDYEKIIVIVSGGRDSTLKVWTIVNNGNAKLLASYEVDQIAKYIASTNSFHVAIAHYNNASLRMLSIVLDNATTPINVIEPLKTKNVYIVSLSSSQVSNLYATSTSDCKIMVWTERNELARTLQFDSVIFSFVFSVDRQNLLVAFQQRVYIIRSNDYLPQQFIRSLILSDTFDPTSAAEIRFRHDNSIGLKFERTEFPKYKYNYKKHNAKQLKSIEMKFELDEEFKEVVESRDGTTDEEDIDSLSSEPLYWKKLPENVRKTLRDLKDKRNREI